MLRLNQITNLREVIDIFAHMRAIFYIFTH